MADADPSEQKRRKLVPLGSSPCRSSNAAPLPSATPRKNTIPPSLFDDVPHALLTAVAEFLPVPSRALFAAAVTAPSSSWRAHFRGRRPSAAGRAILRSTSSGDDPWSELDFGNIEPLLAETLLDDDLVGALACAIHAADSSSSRLRVLKLAGCTAICGHGLEPLRGSNTIETVDLSLAGWRNDVFVRPEPSVLSQSGVVPILESIAEAEGSWLRWVCVPKEWDERPGTEMIRFLRTWCETADLAQPRRNFSSFFLYATASRLQVKSENPTANFADVARILAQQYKELPKEDLEHWDRHAASDKERYKREMQVYDSGIVMYKIVHRVGGTHSNVRLADAHFEHISAPY